MLGPSECNALLHDHPELAPASAIFGRDAYDRYIALTLPFAKNTEYLKGIGHRDAALYDSRILTLQDGA